MTMMIRNAPLSGVYTIIHVRRTCTPYRCTTYMYDSVNTALRISVKTEMFSFITLHYIIKLLIVAKVKKTARSTMAQVTQQCQDMTAEISVSSVFDEMTIQSVSEAAQR